jgi:AcrR family transcriptional regulator
MPSIEERLAAVESEIAQMKARRARLIPPELDGNPNVQLVMKDCLRHYFEKMQDFAGQRTLDERTTEMNRLRAEAAHRLEQKQKEELAEIIEAIEYYERTGASPPGYSISG